MFSIIVAHDKNRGIANNGKLPWPHNRADMKRFVDITTRTTDPKKCNGVIMGRKTWESIDEKYRPLANRLNVILSRSVEITEEATMTCTEFEDALHLLTYQPHVERIFVIGGEEVYKLALNDPRCETIYVTEFKAEFVCNKFFPEIPNHFTLVEDVHNSLLLEFKTYKSQYDLKSPEYQYLDLLQHIMDSGEEITPDEERTGTGTLSVFSGHMRFPIDTINPEEADPKLLQYRVPILTTKNLFYRGVFWELIMFLRGETNTKMLKKKKISIWDGNTSREYLDNIGLSDYKEGETGPFYGFQWNFFGGDYLGPDSVNVHAKDPRGVNQLEYCLNLLKTDPFSRRIVLSAWNPVDLPRMCLPPCHVTYVFKVSKGRPGQKMRLNCTMLQRSGDMFLGIPFNIFSTSLLTILMSRAAGMLPGEISITIADAHIYQNQIEQVKTQVQRIPYKFPILEIPMDIDSLDDMRNLDYKKHFKLSDYNKWAAIKAKMAV